MHVALRTALVLFTLPLVACGGPSVESLCDRIADCTGEPRSDCVDEGNAYKKAAEEQGCGDLFDDYLSCIDDNLECVDGEPQGADACENVLDGCDAPG